MRGECSPVYPIELCQPPRNRERQHGNDKTEDECCHEWQPQLGKVSVSQGNPTFDADAEEKIDRNCLVEGLRQTQVTFDGNSEKAQCESENWR